MLDQSYSAKNFRKIFDIENRKGNYLEGEFFSNVATKSDLIRSYRKEFRQLKIKKTVISLEEYEKKGDGLTKKLNILKEEKEKLLTNELEKVSAEISTEGFSFGIRQIDVGNTKNVFVADRTASTFFCLKQIQLNIHRLYKVKQGNRYQIICQLRELLDDKFPMYILRTDISLFYESIPRAKLLRKLRDDPLLTSTSKKIIKRILFEYSQLTGQDIGLPRGIGISAYLAELYMREIDNLIQNYPGVLYYARYVDDMLVLFCPPPNTGIFKFLWALFHKFKELGLKKNRNKTEMFKVPREHPFSIEYLGYKFIIQQDKIELRMTDKKVERYKKRLNLIFAAYVNQSKTAEKRARSLLEQRIKFLTGNTRLVNNKKNVVSGIYFSNPLLTNLQDLCNLDDCLKSKISTLDSNRLKNRLSKHSFVCGFEKKTYFKFSAQDLSRIVDVWKYAS